MNMDGTGVGVRAQRNLEARKARVWDDAKLTAVFTFASATSPPTSPTRVETEVTSSQKSTATVTVTMKERQERQRAREVVLDPV